MTGTTATPWCICSTCREKHFPDFRLGVPFAGKYYKVIDSDAQEYRRQRP